MFGQPFKMQPIKKKFPRQAMPEQEAKERIKNFQEVPFGYTPEMAKIEASRCLQCKKPLCVKGCPVEVDIPGFIALIAKGDFTASGKKIKETNSLPAVCGRVCPQETQCEQYCILGKKEEPVAIGRLERFAADWERSESEKIEIPAIASPKNEVPATGGGEVLNAVNGEVPAAVNAVNGEIPAAVNAVKGKAPTAGEGKVLNMLNGKRVAVVGSGPAGLTAAGELTKLGYEVTIFEALHKPGGVLMYGIPEFRLPKKIVEAEIDYIKKLGVKLETNVVVGKLKSVDELLQDGFSAVFIGTGAGLPSFMNIPGENLNGVYSANEYLTRSNLMKAYLFPQYDTPIARGKQAAVIGGGNVAMDSARTALRLGAEEVTIVYRRSRNEMPARIEEIHHTEQEGIKFHLLTLPVRFMGNEKGRVHAMECLSMELGEPDESGRKRPVPIKGSEFTIDVDTVIVAIGNSPNPLVPADTPDLKTGKWGNIIADESTGQTGKKGVFAGGDIVSGAATVIEAMGAGRRAAKAIDKYLVSV